MADLDRFVHAARFAEAPRPAKHVSLASYRDGRVNRDEFSCYINVSQLPKTPWSLSLRHLMHPSA